jgi:hypothetical protein
MAPGNARVECGGLPPLFAVQACYNGQRKGAFVVSTQTTNARALSLSTRAPAVEVRLKRPQEIQQILLLRIAQAVEDGDHAIRLRALAGMVLNRLQ